MTDTKELKLYCGRYKDVLLTIVDVMIPDNVLPDDYKLLFGDNFTKLSKRQSSYLTTSKRVLNEPGGLTTDIYVLDLEIPLFSPRYVALTKYAFWEFKER